jgi:hypothetical protein
MLIGDSLTPSGNNIILAGIPRSGTSFVCSLLNKTDGTLALVEPLDMAAFSKCRNQYERHVFLSNYFEYSRKSILKEKKINTLDFDSDSNTFVNDAHHKRKTTIKGFKALEVNKNLDSDFTFVIKHPNAFSALLNELCASWRCFAVVRNPVSVIASWSSLDHPLSEGRAPMAELFDDELRRKLDSTQNTLLRQVHLVNWYFERYHQFLSPSQIIFYESVVKTSGKCLSNVAPAAQLLSENISSMNNNKIYDKAVMSKIAKVLESCGGFWAKFYTVSDINKVLG